MSAQQGQNYESGNVATYNSEAAIEAYRLVKHGTAEGDVVACSAITDIAIGVSLNRTTAANQRVEVQTRGIAMLTVSAAVARLAQVMPTGVAGGKGSTAAGATAKSCAQALQAAGGDGETIAVQLACPNLNGPANT